MESLQNSVDLLQYEEYHIPPEGAPLGGPTVTKHQSLSTEESDAVEDIPLQDVDEEVIWMEGNWEVPEAAPESFNEEVSTEPPPTPAPTTTPPTLRAVPAGAPSSVASGRASVVSRYVQASAAPVRSAPTQQQQLDSAKTGGCTVRLWRMGDLKATAPKPLFKVKKAYRQWEQFLQAATKALPNAAHGDTRAIKRVYTRDGHRVTSLAELQPNGVYLCSGSCHFKPEHVPAIAHRTPTVAVDVDSHRSVSQLPSPARH